MASQNRHLKGDIHPIIAPVHSYHTVEAGDFMVLNSTGGTLGSGVAADNYAVPFQYTLCVATSAEMAHHVRWSQFLGVAMEASASGVTENITIATDGVFRYPLYTPQIGCGVTIGALVSAVSNTQAAGTSDQMVAIGTPAAGTLSCTAYLGYIVKSESGATFVDLLIRTAYGPGGNAS